MKSHCEAASKIVSGISGSNSTPFNSDDIISDGLKVCDDLTKAEQHTTNHVVDMGGAMEIAPVIENITGTIPKPGHFITNDRC